MADPISERYKRAAQLRLLSMMPPSYTPMPGEGVNQIVQALLSGRGGMADPRAVSDADYAAPTMAPPPGLLAAPTVTAPPVTVTATRPPMQAPAAPEQPMDTYADMAGFGVSPRLPDAPDYRHLNPTPSLAEVYRRELAGNPNGFTPGRFFGLLG